MRAHVRPTHTALEVHDNGLGIDAAHLPRLFTMFPRFHDHVDGTGSGLPGRSAFNHCHIR